MSMRDQKAGGFTLLEVMIALAVGGIALSSMYAVGSASTRHFRQQQRISATQTSLRAAMDILKRDFQRAGFMSTPNARMAGETCTLTQGIDGSNQLAAVAGYLKGVSKPESLDPSGLNVSSFYTVDQVWLTGNFATTGEYSGISIDADGRTITIPMSWQSFRRDFTDWAGTTAGSCNAAAFQAAFPVGRLVRVHGLNERNFYSRVRSTVCTGTTSATVVLEDDIPLHCNLNGGWIAPVNTMRYAVVDATGEERSRIGLNRVSVLRRTEVQPGARTQPLRLTLGSEDPVEDRALLDYVVHFNVNFMLRRDDGTSIVTMMPFADTAVRANPERVRGVIIDLAARTAEHEPEYSADVAAAAFRVHDTAGAARVRRAHAELLLPNVAYRGL